MKEGPPADHSSQRLSEETLTQWRGLSYGMFIHYGMNTFSTERAPAHCNPLPVERYAPTGLDVDQWMAVARDAGMKYAILTTVHGTGFCLWPTKVTDYNVAGAGAADVLELFVKACEKYQVRPAFYTCGAHDRRPAETKGDNSQEALIERTCRQVTELVTQYGPIAEMWFDGPGQYGAAGRRQLYDLVAELQPKCVVANNGAFDTNGHKSVVKPETWPTDVIVIEAGVPPFWTIDRFDLGEDVTGKGGQPQEYFLPTEVVTCMDNMADRWWFGGPNAVVRSVRELTAIRMLCHVREANCVLNVPPTPEGRLRPDYVDALLAVARAWEAHV